MVRIAFTPKSVENQWVKSVKYEEIAAKVLLPSGPSPAVYRIALCEDGKPGLPSSADSIRGYFSDLFRRWGMTTTIQIYSFTFIDNTTEAYELLVNCDMFYFAGVFNKLPALKNVSLVEILRGRVQCNEICYLGVCGGAKLCGYSPRYGCCGLDLLDGVDVLYPTTAPRFTKVETNADKVQMTRGCAAFILMTPDEQRGTTICVIKNKDQWRRFEILNSLAMQTFVQKKARSWNIVQPKH